LRVVKGLDGLTVLAISLGFLRLRVYTYRVRVKGAGSDGSRDPLELSARAHDLVGFGGECFSTKIKAC